MLSISSINSYAVVYQNNGGSSSIIRFIKNLFTGGQAEPSVVSLPGGNPGALYHSQDFQSSSTISTTPHILNDAGVSGPSFSSVWNISNNGASTSSSPRSIGSSNVTSQGSGTLSLPMVSSVTMQSSGNFNASNSGSASGSTSGGISSAGGMALFAVSLPQSNLVTAINNQNNNYSSTNNGGTTGNNGNYDGDGWLNDPSEPMPVGDATLPMLIFAAGYTLLIYRKVRKKKLDPTNFS